MAGGAAGFDVTARGLDHVLDDREPEAAAARGTGAVGAEEALEQPRRVLLGDAGPVVAHLEHDLAVLATESNHTGRALAGVANGVLEEVVGDSAEHAPAERDEQLLILDLDLQADSGQLGTLELLVDEGSKKRRGLRLAERYDLAPLLELAQEEDVVDQLGHLLDLIARLREERGLVGAGQLGRLEQRQQPGERRPQLVRDGRRKGRAELLVLGPGH